MHMLNAIFSFFYNSIVVVYVVAIADLKRYGIVAIVMNCLYLGNRIN